MFLWGDSGPGAFPPRFHLAFTISENIEMLRIRTKLSLSDMTFVE